MHIVFYGAGGVGGNFGGYMARAGLDVTFIARGAHLRAIQEHGLKIESPKGNFLVKVKATDDPAKAGKADVIFICLKAWQIEEVIAKIPAMMGSDTVVIPLQNWIEASDFLASSLGPGHVLGGVCYTVSKIIGPGVIHGDGGKILFGALDRSLAAQAKRLEEIFRNVPGISVRNVRNIRREMWKKFTWISSVGALGAAIGESDGAGGKSPGKRTLLKILLREAYAVANASKANLTWWDFAKTMRWLNSLGDLKTSMQRDMAAGVRSELEYQVGTVVRLGKKLNVPTPESEAIYTALLPCELRAQKRLLSLPTQG
jgi:2-dehydropantoate 2-reductase